MDYEKKYNHALEVVRELQKDWASTQNRAAREIELAFPELRESEDEKMFKRVIESLVCFRGKVIAEGDESLAKLVDKEIQWMLKCKESLHIPETCKENADSFTNDERIRKAIISLVHENSFAYKSFAGIDLCDMLAWLERQKEQKPNIELIQRSWYMEGYHDREFGKEPKWIIKTGEGGPKHELNPKYGQSLAENSKEQKPVEK